MRAVSALAFAAIVAVAPGSLLRSGAEPAKGDVTSEELETRVMALQPVLEKLRGLDPKTFGALSGMLSQAEAGRPRGSSFLEYLRDSPSDVQDKLEKLGPVLEKLQGLDPKAFGMLSSMMAQATSKHT